MSDCFFEYEAPAARCIDGSHEGETIHTAAAHILVPIRPLQKGEDGHWVYERYRRNSEGNYEAEGVEVEHVS